MTADVLNSTFVAGRRTKKTELKRSRMGIQRVECRVRTSNQITQYRQMEDLVK
jgi:hypothetical protein